MDLILSLSAAQGWKVLQPYVKNAFVNDDLDVEIFTSQQKGFVVQGNKSHVCELNKSLYDFKQAPRAWYKKILGYFENLGFSKC